MKILLVFTLLVGTLLGQQTSSTLSMQTPPPNGVQTVSAFTVGNQGNSNYCYWVVAVYAGGMASPLTNSCVARSAATLNSSNYNTISWSLATQATGYWVIRATTSNFPATGTTAVNTTVLSSTTSTLNDQSNTLHAFTFSPMSVANASFSLQNTNNYSQPWIKFDAPMNITHFAFLPAAASATGLLYIIDDSSSTVTCSGGGGTGTPALCWSNGVTWIPMAAAVSGGTTTIQTNGVNNTSQNPVNFTNSAPFNGLTLTQTNTSGGIVQLGVTGSLNLAGLTPISGDNVVGNFTSGSAVPSTQLIPTCANDGSHALVYVGHTLTCATITVGGSGTVTSFSAGTLAPLFTTSVATSTTTPALTFALSNFSADNIFGNFTGGSAAPSVQAIPACANDGVHALVYVSHILTCAALTTGGAGTVTSVSFTGGLISVANPTTTPAFTVAGTSGGIPYFSSSSTWATSAALTANLPVIGGGAGTPPSVGTRSGNTTAFVTTTGSQTSGDCVKIDASGNHIANGSPCGSSSGGSVFTGSTASAPSFSATPTFSLADVSVKSPVRVEAGTLTANVTAVTFTNKTAGAKFSLVWTQDGTGGRTVTYGSVTGNCVVDPTASIATTQFFEVAADGSTVVGTGCSTNNTGVEGGPEAAAPGTPTSGNWFCWTDSTTHVRSCKTNNSSTVSNMVVPSTCGGSNFVSGVSTAGVLTCTTPAGSGTVTSSGPPLIHQVPVFTTATDITGIAVGATDKPLVGVSASNPVFSKVTLTNPATSATLTLADGSTLATSGANSLTFITTSTSNVTVPAGTSSMAVNFVGGTATLGTSAIGGNACATAVSAGATGVATTDIIQFTPNADISAVTGYGAGASDGLVIYPYPTSNFVNFKVCNVTGTSITPGAVTLNWRVTR